MCVYSLFFGTRRVTITTVVNAFTQKTLFSGASGCYFPFDHAQL